MRDRSRLIGLMMTVNEALYGRWAYQIMRHAGGMLTTRTATPAMRWQTLNLLSTIKLQFAGSSIAEMASEAAHYIQEDMKHDN